MQAILTNEQKQAVDGAVGAVKNGTDLYRIGGYAGTGKTTVAKYIAAGLKRGMFCAFTGKAACRLTQKGLASITIHRTIYDFDPYSWKFFKKEMLDGDYFLIDEGSMISTTLWDDIESFAKPVIMLGDPGQLDPVGGDPRLMHKPDIILEQIHRQAADCGIVQYATDIRLDKYTPDARYPDVQITYGQNPKVKDLKWANIIICGYNRTRIKLNRKIRQINGYTGLLTPGESIICLRNNMKISIFNGQILTVQKVISQTKRIITAECTTDDGRTIRLPLLKEQFNRKLIDMNDLPKGCGMFILADYGYCITCHKSQGSEWDNVLVIDEQCPCVWDTRRWRYTAITRAAKGLRYFYK